MGVEELMARVGEYLPAERMALVTEAYEYAARMHEGQRRLSNDPYIVHPVATALTLAGLQLDAVSLAAALLHDVPENCDVPLAEIESKFGPEVTRLVGGVTRLGRISWQEPGEGATRLQQAENLRKMLVAMAQDLRVVFIKLADRLHNMSTLFALPEQKRQIIAQDTLEIYTPLAHRLGIWELKWQLEDLSFRELDRKTYDWIAQLLEDRRDERERKVASIIKTLKGEFTRLGIDAEITGRPKHIYSIYHKMQKYSALGKRFDDIHDLLALRMLVDSVTDCYGALGAVHSLWHPIPGEFDDFIANPKPNGYQSLHTAVMYEGRVPLAVQIRTREMHYIAEYGMAAHWRYKQGKTQDMSFEDRITGLRQMIDDWHQELSEAEDFLESVKTDVFIDQVFVFTPKGEIKDMPKGSTALDFAYRVHTEVGHSCVGAKVNGRLVPLNYQLNNGDVVEIITAKRRRGPSSDWLQPHLGYVQTSHARTKIRQWFKKQERADNIERGRELLEKELAHLGLKHIEREELARLCKYDTLDDLLAAIGGGDITTHSIALKLAAQQEPPRTLPAAAPTKPVASPVTVLGVGDLLTHLARCCRPVPGDKIIGYVTRSRGVTIHRQDCYNVVYEDEKERLIPVQWHINDTVYPVHIQVEAWDRVGLIRDITTVVAEEKVNIEGANVTNHDDHTITLYFTLETTGLAQLSRLMVKIEGVRGVLGVARIGDQAVSGTPAVRLETYDRT